MKVNANPPMPGTREPPKSAAASALEIREEHGGDAEAIRAVLMKAFPTDAEARLVEALRTTARLAVSLVAVCDGRIIGHIGFSPITSGGREVGQGLAPVAVSPEHQRRGVGATLIRRGLEMCGRRGAPLVVVLGDPQYYARFGFRPAKLWNLCDEYGGGDAFQALWTDAAIASEPARNVGGLVRYAPEFSLFSD